MLWSAFILGLLGSLHCAAMCGPFMLGLAARQYSLFSLIVHHLGRWLGYILLATFFYFIVSPLQIFELQQYVGLVSGVLLVIYGLKSYIPVVNKMFARVTAIISNKMIKSKAGRTGNVILGILNGLLPCGLSFGAAIMSVNAGSIGASALYMIVFGLGTLPILLAMSYLPKLGLQKSLMSLNAWTPRILVIMGFVLILRSAGLGIPYLSPTYDVQEEKMECCDH
ncbi:MAG: sulfite exporter TauE/SafE family protein [Bacteroidia bacterium]